MEVKTLSIWPIFGSIGPKMANFRDPSLEKVAELWPRRGSVLHFWTPKDPQILKVHKMRQKTLFFWEKDSHLGCLAPKNPYLVAFFLSIQELVSFITKKEGLEVRFISKSSSRPFKGFPNRKL